MPIPSSVVTKFRELWQTRFTDAINVTRLNTRGAMNETTLKYDSEFSTVPYTGAALIRPTDTKGQTDQFGEQLVTGRTVDVFVPSSAVFADDFQPEDLVTVTASVLDSGLVGQEMRVVSSEQFDSYLTRIKLTCRLEEGPGYAG